MRNPERAILIADGDLSQLECLVQQELGKGFMIALDGAARRLKESSRFKPDLILGDMDELTQIEQDEFLQKGVKVLRISEQNTTDLEKGLIYCQENGLTEAAILGAFGKRADHSLVNLGLLKKYSLSGMKLKLVTAFDEISFVKDSKFQLSGPTGRRISMLGFTEAVVNSEGLKYPLCNYRLRFGETDSASNELTQTTASLEINGEAIVIQELLLDRQ